MTFLNKLIVNDKSFYKKVLTLALPIALQSAINIGVNILDTIMVGNLGETQLSATSLANSFITIFHILCMGIGMGASVLISRYWGMKMQENEKASLCLKKTICIMIRLVLFLATIFAIITFFFPNFIMKAYTSEQKIIDFGIIYFKYSVVTYFFLGLSLVCTLALRSIGQVKFPLFVSIAAFFINIFSNYVLIFGKFGFPRLEIAGAALATLIARIFETSMILGYLLFKDKKICFRIKDLFMKTSDLLWEYIRISIPVLISDSLLAFGMNAVYMIIGRLGQTFVAANAITAVTQQVSSVVIQGVSQSGAIITGQTLGKGETQKTMEQGFGFLGFGIILGIFASLCILIINPFVINSYNIAPITKETTKNLMFAISIIILFHATNSIMTKGVLRGGGDTKILMIADNIFLWLISIPLGILTGFVFKLSPFWIYIALKSDDIIKAIWCVLRLKSGKWIKKIKLNK